MIVFFFFLGDNCENSKLNGREEEGRDEGINKEGKVVKLWSAELKLFGTSLFLSRVI